MSLIPTKWSVQFIPPPRRAPRFLVFAVLITAVLAGCGAESSGVGGDGLAPRPGADGGVPMGDAGRPEPDAGLPDPDAGVPGTGTPGVPLSVAITAPPQGTFVPGTEMTVLGTSENADAADSFTVNGVPVDVRADGSWEVDVTLDAHAIANPIVAELRRAADATIVRDRITVFTGESIADGAYSPEAIALRINDSALDQAEAAMASLVGGDLDLGQLVPVGTRIIDDQCFINVGGSCWGSADVEIDSPAPNFSDFDIDLDARSGHLHAEITVSNMEINLAIKGSGLVPDCDLTLEADAVQFSGDFRIQPEENEPNTIDVDLLGDIQVSFVGFDTEFDGICDAPIIGDIIQSAVPDVEPLAVDAISGFLQDPDGKGPVDDPVSQAAEDALAGMSLTGPIANALMVNLQAPLLETPMDASGITIVSDGLVEAPNVPAGAPDFRASVHIDAPFPTPGPRTPNGRNYDLGICVSPSFFNQLLKATTESGLLSNEITEFNELPLTAGALVLLAPEFSALPATTPLKFVVVAEAAPFLTGRPGPNGELGELVLPQLMMEIRSVSDDTLHASISLDARTGVELGIGAGGKLAASISTPTIDDIDIMVVDNAIGANVANVEMLLPALVEGALPNIAGALGEFPLPTFLGLRLEVVEASRDGGFYSLYTALR